MYRKTIKSKIYFSGKGLHSGKMYSVTLHPSSKNGIEFVVNNEFIQYNEWNVFNTNLQTSLKNEGSINTINTVEHLISAFHALNITDIIVNVLCTEDTNYFEIPIFDGSSKFFYDIINDCGLKELTEKCNYFSYDKKIKVSDENGFIEFHPNEDLIIHAIFENKFFLEDIYGFTLKQYSDICDAKTFCSYKDIEFLRSNGYIKGGDKENALIYDETGKILNPEYYNGTKNFVKHKLIDFIGDIYCLGPIKGEFFIKNPNHTLNNLFCRKIKYFTKTMEENNG